MQTKKYTLTACAVSLTLEEPTEEQRDLINAHPEGCGFWAWLFEYTGLRMGEANVCNGKWWRSSFWVMPTS